LIDYLSSKRDFRRNLQPLISYFILPLVFIIKSIKVVSINFIELTFIKEATNFITYFELNCFTINEKYFTEYLSKETASY